MLGKQMTWQLRLGIFTFCIFFTSASYTMCIPFLPVYLLELGAPEESIEFWSAMVFSVCFLIAGIMAPIWGKISDTKGKKSMAMRSAILLCLTYTCGGLVTAPIQLLGVRVLQGFANGYLPVVLSIVSAQSPREKLGTSLSFIQSAQLVGTVSGPLIGGTLANIFGYRASFLIAGAFLVLVVVVTALTSVDEQASPRSTTKSSIWDDIKFSFTERSICELMLLFFFFQMVMLAIQPLLSLFVAQLIGGYDDVAFYAGLACSLPPFIGAFVAPLWGILGQKRGYYLTMTIALWGTGIFIAVQSFANSFATLMVLSGIMGLFIVGFIPAMNALVTLATPADFKGRAFGMLTMTGQLGCMCGPLLGAVVAHLLEIRYQFLVSGSVLLVLALYVSYRYFSIRKAKRHEARQVAAQSAAAAQELREQQAQEYHLQKTLATTAHADSAAAPAHGAEPAPESSASETAMSSDASGSASLKP